MSSREIEDWEAIPSEGVSGRSTAAERLVDFMESDQHRPEDPRRRQRAKDLLIRMDERKREMEKQMVDLEKKGRLSRFMILRANPQLRDYIRYREAQDSIVEARRSAAANEGKIVIF